MRSMLALLFILAGAARGAAAAPAFSVDLYSVPNARLDALAPGARDADEGGSGFGVRALIPMPRRYVLVTGFQSTSYDDNIDYNQFRLGIGSAGVAAGGIGGYAEYVHTELEGATADGLGAHVTLASRAARRFRLHGDAGYLVLQDSSEVLSGWEFTLGATWRLVRRFSVFLDARTTNLEGDTSGLTLGFTDVRMGARVSFDAVPRPPSPRTGRTESSN